MKLNIQKEILETFNPIVGVIYARNLNNATTEAEVGELLGGIYPKVRDAFTGLESPSSHPLVSNWRAAYKKFGSDPHDFRSSIEALSRRILRGDELPRINTLVDLYNYISLKYLLPAGGEDTDAIQGELKLVLAKGDETFVRLGGTENESPAAGEIIYKDDVGVVCRRWNWREADRTKLTENTQNAIIVIEALSPTEKSTVTQATQELVALIQQYCGGETEVEILTSE